MQQQVLRFENVSFSYERERSLFKNISFEIEENDFACIVGPNGSGKSTLLKLILGMLSPQTGNIQLFDSLSPSQARPLIGYMPQTLSVDRDFPVTTLDVVLMGRLRPSWTSLFYSKYDKNQAKKALEEVGLLGFAMQAFSSLSGGQRQRALIARAIVSNPKLLILDEPTAFVDAKMSQNLQEILKKLNSRMSIIMVSHDTRFVASSVNKVICLDSAIHIHPTGPISEESIYKLYGPDIKLIEHSECCKECNCAKKHGDNKGKML